MEARPAQQNATISWPGYGIMFFWQLGIVQFLQNFYDLRKCTMVGSSAGALLSVLAATNVDPQKAADRAYDLCIEHGVFQRPLGLIGVWGSIVRQWLQELLPEDAAERCNGAHVCIVLTTLPTLRRVAVSEFKDREDLIDTALASAHLPFILDYRLWASWRGQLCVDGSLLYILTRRCQYLRPTQGITSLLLFDPFAGLGLRDVISMLSGKCISLPANSKAAVQQLMSGGMVYAEKLAAAGAFAMLPLKQNNETQQKKL